MSVAVTVGWGLALILLAISLWARRHRRVRRPMTAAPVQPLGSKPSEALIWIEDDGRARELTESEKNYVDAGFSPFDGARPYVKSRYDQRNGWGRLNGYLLRKQLPVGVHVDAAPPDSPVVGGTPHAVAESLRELIRKHEGEDR